MRTVIIVFFFPFVVFSQKQNVASDYTHPIDSRTCRSGFEAIKLDSVSSSAIEDYLRERYANVSREIPDVSLKLLSTIESPGGIHFQYQQLYKNVPVYRAQIKVNLDKQGNIKSVFDNSFSIAPGFSSDFPDSSLITRYVDKIAGNYQIENNYFFDGAKLITAVRIQVSKNNRTFYEFFIDENGNNIYQHDLNSYYYASEVDSLVQGLVFLPDPLTRAGVVYGTPYIDNDDSDVAQLNAQRVTVDMKVDYVNDTFRLESPYVIIVDFSPPSIAPAFSKTTPDFLFSRSQSGFEDVNAFYHINFFQQYIQTLGFSNLADEQIWVDTHANNGDDNSLFNPGSPPMLQFGEGGVDDAEDADVIIHEYGHAISYSAAPNTNSGTQRQTVDEGNGDYLASSYSKSINTFKWENVFSWDGHNEFWDGRFSVTSDHYPEDLQNNIYKDADIWSATIMEINTDIGREITDKILFQSMYSYATGMSMTDAAHVFMQADTVLYSGIHYNNICARFKTRGISSCTVGIDEFNKKGVWAILLNSIDFSESGAEIQFKEPSSGSMALTDISGKIVFYDEFFQKNNYPLNSAQLARGMYLLTIRSGVKTTNFKLVKF